LLVFCLGLAASVVVCFTAKMFFAGWGRAATAGDIRVDGVPNGHPTLAFACELPTDRLQALFANPSLIDELRQLHASLSLSLIDLGSGRAAVVRQLNDAGVPVTAWLALSREQGYYLNADNSAAAAARFEAFQDWTSKNGLRWAGVGLDIEPGLQEFTSARQGHWLSVVTTLVRRYLDAGRVSRARSAYLALIRRIQGAGYPVDTYQFPFIADERKAGSTLLERLFGIVDVRGDREVLMTYSSFNPAVDSALVWEYGRDSQLVAVGSTAGDAAGGGFRPLKWDEFARDVIVAGHLFPVVGVYSLEGCSDHQFMPRLAGMDWRQSVTIPANALSTVVRLRMRIQAALWTGSRLPYLAAVVLVLEGWVIRRRAMAEGRRTAG